MPLTISLIICLAVGFIFTLLAKKLNLPTVIGLIPAGLVLGSDFLSQAIIKPNTEVILTIGNIGLISLMFLAGLEISWSRLYKQKKYSTYLAGLAFFIPFILGFSLFIALDYGLATALTVGLCLSITSEATKARVLLEIKKIKTKIGSLMIGAGIIDDLLGIIFFTGISLWFCQALNIRELIVLFSAIAAFFIGTLTNKICGRKRKTVQYLEKGLLRLIVPFFFIAMGLKFSLQSLTFNPWLLFIILITAIAGKMLGSLSLKFFSKFKLKQLYLVGWGMNSRGAVEIAIAFTAFKFGLLNTPVYSSLIITALISTLIFPIFITRALKKNKHIMN